MISEGKGNLLDANVEALVNTVNTVGVMGKGVALQFKIAFPDMFREYQKACRRHEVQIGKMFVYENHPLLDSKSNLKFIINFPTKVHWRDGSQLNYIKEGLKNLSQEIQSRGIKSIALPPLGCGMGGLNWIEVFPLINKTLKQIPDIDVFIYPPTLPTPKKSDG